MLQDPAVRFLRRRPESCRRSGEPVSLAPATFAWWELRSGAARQRGSGYADAVASPPWPCVHEASGAYRPRHPEHTSLYRLLEEHFDDYLRCHEERFEPRDGHLRPHVRKVVEQFLECGRLHQGFARIRCGDCGDEKLLAFSCQTRNLCPSCQAKRAALFGMKLAEEVLAPVPHTHLTFTIPKALRALFQRDRRLLGILSRAAYAALREVMQSALGRKDVVPGFVASLQTFGSYGDNWQPHVHGLASEGAFTGEGDFITLWNLDTDAVEARFREYVLQELQRADRLSEEFADQLRTWSPSGFDVFAGRQVSMGETKCIEEMGRYMTRPPLAQDAVEILSNGKVLIPTPPDPRTGATELILDPIELVHRIVMQIPDKGSHCTRYYGAYANRAKRARAERPTVEVTPVSPTVLAATTPDPATDTTDTTDVDEHTRERRRTWARMLRHIFEVDPLVCAKCGGEMRVISVITDPPVVQRILQHLEKKAAHAEPDSS